MHTVYAGARIVYGSSTYQSLLQATLFSPYVHGVNPPQHTRIRSSLRKYVAMRLNYPQQPTIGPTKTPNEEQTPGTPGPIIQPPPLFTLHSGVSIVAARFSYPNIPGSQNKSQGDLQLNNLRVISRCLPLLRLTRGYKVTTSMGPDVGERLVAR